MTIITASRNASTYNKRGLAVGLEFIKNLMLTGFSSL